MSSNTSPVNMFDFPTSLFGMVGTVYGLILPLLLLNLIALLFIPSLMRGGVQAMSVGKAIYCYLLQIIGVLLMTIGGIPAIYGVLASQAYESNTYLALLIVFACGGFTFLWHDHMIRQTDAPSRAVPHAIYVTLFKLLGYLLTLVSALSLLLTMLLGLGTLLPNWWIMPTITLFYGLLLTWCTRSEGNGSPFQSSPMHARPAAAKPPVKAKKK